MNEKIANIIDGAVREVVEGMAGIPMQTKDAFSIQNDHALGEMTAIISFSGLQLVGAVVIHFNRAMAFAIMKAIFEMESEEINDEVLDAIGEVTNMICGKVKTDLVKSGMAEFNISVPTIVIGQNFMTYVRGVNAKSVVYPFFNEDGSQTINVEVKLEVK